MTAVRRTRQQAQYHWLTRTCLHERLGLVTPFGKERLTLGFYLFELHSLAFINTAIQASFSYKGQSKSKIMAPSTSYPGFSAHVTITIAPENVSKLLEIMKPVIDKVAQEPAFLFFEMFQDPVDLGVLTWVENWYGEISVYGICNTYTSLRSESPEWFMKVNFYLS
jgi:hypothetical protein